MSNTNTPNTLLSLLENYRVEIPRLQRDYVQGRNNNEKVKAVRTNLLKDIKDAVEQVREQLDLNFVYGKSVEIKDGKLFLPVDGQQRLTTLFLLHLYAFSDDDDKTELFKKFSYEARTTTRDFFSALIKYRKEIFAAEEEPEEPSKFITDASWFDDSWKDKSTVKDALKNLDDLVAKGHNKYDAKTELFNNASTSGRGFFSALNKHWDEVFAKITRFITDASWFVDSWKYDPSVLSALTMLDDIVAQGYDKDKLREQFENSVKPSVFFHFVELSDLGREDDLYIKLNARGRSLTPFENFKSQFVTQCKKVCEEKGDKELYTEIESALDNKWADYIWDKGEEEKYDEYYLDFFDNVLSNHKILQKDKNNNTSNNEDPFNWIYTYDYSKIDYSVFKTIRNTLNYISSYTESDASEITVDRLKNKEYSKLVKFHAVCKYLETEDDPKKVDSDEFSAWLRVNRNLVNNSSIDEYDQWSKAIDSINNELGLYKKANTSFYDFLAKSDMSEPLPGFNLEQVKEERLKAKIIISGNAQKQAILDAEEKLGYFSGQIRSAIYFSGLKDDVSQFNISEFNKYVAKIEFLFDTSAPKDGNLLRRALCSIADYRIKVGNYKTLCVDNPNDNNSLKRLFSEHGDTVKKLLDLIDETKSLKDELNKIIDSFKTSIRQSDWRYCIVNYPELLSGYRGMEDYKMQAYRMYDTGEYYGILMIPNIARNGKNIQIYLFTLKIALDKKNIHLNYYTEIGTEPDERCLFKEDIKVTYFLGQYSVAYSVANGIVDEWSSSRPDKIDETVEYISLYMLKIDLEKKGLDFKFGSDTNWYLANQNDSIRVTTYTNGVYAVEHTGTKVKKWFSSRWNVIDKTVEYISKIGGKAEA